MEETFITTNKRDYIWPFPKSMVSVASAPPLRTKPRDLYMPKPVLNCDCDGHGWNPHMERFRCLADKEKRLIQDISELRKEMTRLNNNILECPCGDTDSKLKTVSQLDYVMKDYNPAHYRSVMAAIDSPVGTPIEPLNIKIQRGYRDPTSFRYMPTVRPTIDPNRPLTFLTTPFTVNQWFQPWPGRTEYQDSYSKIGQAIIKTSQQYKEPMPSSRRRFGERCI